MDVDQCPNIYHETVRRHPDTDSPGIQGKLHVCLPLGGQCVFLPIVAFTTALRRSQYRNPYPVWGDGVESDFQMWIIIDARRRTPRPLELVLVLPMRNQQSG
jgi:hypothetical protein